MHAVLDEVIVVEQGTKKVADDAALPARPRTSLRGKLRLIEQGNMGGSGGYARSQFETLEAGRSTYMMCMDDDVVCEPESIVRAVTFGDLCRTPTIVGGHMFSLYSKSRLHSFGEIINQYRFWWHVAADRSRPTGTSPAATCAVARWLHRRIDVDFNGWFMCLIPTEVLRTVGLSLPLFIKWDDSEFGVRAAAAGFPTVTLPGAAVWHVPWTDKNDALDWQSYFHQRNRTIAALLHSPYEHGGRVVRESFNHQVKHLFSMQYSTAELRHLALEDVLAGPGDAARRAAHEAPRAAGQAQAVRRRADHARPGGVPAGTSREAAEEGQDPTQPKGRLGQLVAAATSAVRQTRPVRELAARHPEAAARGDGRQVVDDRAVRLRRRLDARRHQRVVVPARHATEFRDLLRRTVEIHQRLHREWPALARRYRQALPDIVSPDQWAKTFEHSASRGGDVTTQSERPPRARRRTPRTTRETRPAG